MPSPEAPPQESPLSAEQQKIWCFLVKKAALRALQPMEALYLSEEEQEAYRELPLTEARYNVWHVWMEAIDEDPTLLFKWHSFVDERLLADSAGAFTRAMEALEELRTTKRLSESTKKNLGIELREGRSFIMVPDIDAVDLTALVREELNLTFLDPDYERWNYYQGNDGKPISGRGKIFEVMMWKPGREVSSGEVRAHFAAEGFTGHAGAFTWWRRVCGLNGKYSSIPEDNGCWRDSAGNLCVPYSYFDNDGRGLSYEDVGGEWFAALSFVAFREV